MKKLFSIAVILCMFVALFAMLVSCEGADDLLANGLSQEAWEEALEEERFDNVTIESKGTTVDTGIASTQVIKISGDKVYRTATAMGTTQSIIFSGNEATIQREMFLQVMLSILAEQGDFEYDTEEQVYLSKNAISKVVDTNGGMKDHVTMTSGKVRFNSKGDLIYFECTLEEKIYQGETLVMEQTNDTVWNFKDYGSTEITAAEIDGAIDGNALIG